MSPLLLPFHPDAPPGSPARASDGAEPVAPAAGELPRVLPSHVHVDKRAGLYLVRSADAEVVEVVGDDGFRAVARDKVRGVA